MQEQSQIQEISIVSHNILEELKVGVVTRQRLSLLEHYDLSKVTSQLIDKGPRFSPEQIWPLRQYFGKADLELACTLEREFKRFVALTLIRPGHVYAPSGPVDMYWHFFVLHTREYEKFCEVIWGNSIDHGRLPADSVPVPSVNTSERSQKQNNKDTKEILEYIAPGQIYSSISQEAKEQLERLAAYDLSFFTEHLVDRGRQFSPEQAFPIKAHFGKADLEVMNLIEKEFRRFVVLTIIKPGEVFAPSGPVDMYWHFLILHTEDYRDFCNQIWGAFQHHPRGSQYEDVQNATLSDNWNDINA